MLSASLDSQANNALPFLDAASKFGVRVNAMSVDDLFAMYERTGFLYPAKAARLIPYMDRVRANWHRVLRAGDSLLYVLTAGEKKEGRASIAVWRTSSHGWTWQHLVCEKNPLHSRAVMLGGLTRCIREDIGESQQNWFRPENRFPARVFGSMVQSVGDSHACVRQHMFFAVPRPTTRRADESVRTVHYDPSHYGAFCTLALLARGNVYLTAEEFAGDMDLRGVNQMYRCVGLQRTREVWLAYRDGHEGAVGAAVAYRGPLGLNFSFIENRCDLLLHPGLSADDAATVSVSLLEAAVAAYDDFELEDIPVVAEQVAVPAIHVLGGRFLRHYCQGIWLKAIQPALYRHVDGFYTRLLDRVEKRRTHGTLTT